MIVKCIKLCGTEHLTLGKHYTLKRDDEDMVTVEMNDYGVPRCYPSRLFEIVTEEDEPKYLPFGELAELDQMNLFASWLRGAVIEYLGGDTGRWYVDKHPKWAKEGTYRIKPEELTKPSIDWSHIHKDYKWMATDQDGDSYLYTELPKQVNDIWNTKCIEPLANPFISFKAGTCDWKDSLVERPHE